MVSTILTPVRFYPTCWGLAIVLLLSCGDDEVPLESDLAADADPDADPDADLEPETRPDDGSTTPRPDTVEIQVNLDGRPSPDTVVVQGGVVGEWRTGDDGSAVVPIDWEIEGAIVLLASHPEARIGAVNVAEDTSEPVVVDLVRYDASDNHKYAFQDPGTPERRFTTSECGHCHQTMNDSWYASPHRASASNPIVHDLYAATAAAADSSESCDQLGGRWIRGREPGSGGELTRRCYVGEGVLPTLNEACRDGPCDGDFTELGACADCHAPGIDGELGGRDLLEATGVGFESGVSCDVCHRVDAIDLEAAPGVGGRLVMTRPSEIGSASLGAGGFLPLTFCVNHDVANPRMGCVQREHFRSALICAGCHQLDQAVLVPDVEVDLDRWPGGRFPVHSTYDEWQYGPIAATMNCIACHMPPDEEVANGADLQLYPDAEVGIPGGWYRPLGTVREHSWIGPRQPERGMLERAANLFIETTTGEGRVRAAVSVRNVGAGHAIPTGEPMRAILLRVRATCGDEPLTAVDGDAIPDFGGWLERRDADEDWSDWPLAEAGDVIRVVRRSGAFYDYTGFGPFGDDTFSTEERGMPEEEVVGEVSVLGNDGEEITLDEALPEGDAAYLVRGDDMLAGSAGFGFARVLVGAEGRRMVPHFAAIDVASDNRLLPQQSWTSHHVFEAECADPEVTAELIYRRLPLWLSAERGWDVADYTMAVFP
jgi:hypothetical protein